MSVADFLDRTRRAIEAVGGTFDIHGAPDEVPDAIPFADDARPRPYDADAVERFHEALLRIVPAFERASAPRSSARSAPCTSSGARSYLAVTRFSGRPAPPHPGGFPGLPDAVAREAYSHEVSSAGFWPGGGGAEEGDVLTPTPIRRPTASPSAPWSPKPRAGTRAWASSCSPTRPSGRAPIPRAC